MSEIANQTSSRMPVERYRPFSEQFPVPLTDREFHLLRRLVQARGSIVSRERLLAEVWDFNFVPHTNALDVCVSRLREKVGRDTIATVRSAGYRVVVNGR